MYNYKGTYIFGFSTSCSWKSCRCLYENKNNYTTEVIKKMLKDSTSGINMFTFFFPIKTFQPLLPLFFTNPPVPLKIISLNTITLLFFSLLLLISFLGNFILFIDDVHSWIIIVPYVILAISKFTHKPLSPQFFELLNSKDTLIHSISIFCSQDHSQMLPSQIKWKTFEISFSHPPLRTLPPIYHLHFSNIPKHFFSLTETSKSMRLPSSIMALLSLSLHVSYSQPF